MTRADKKGARERWRSRRLCQALPFLGDKRGPKERSAAPTEKKKGNV